MFDVSVSHSSRIIIIDIILPFAATAAAAAEACGCVCVCVRLSIQVNNIPNTKYRGLSTFVDLTFYSGKFCVPLYPYIGITVIVWREAKTKREMKQKDPHTHTHTHEMLDDDA